MYLVSGGSGSGKSAFAEACVLRSRATTRVYLATMQVWGEEDRQRVARHRRMRQSKGFVTLEKTHDLADLQIPAHCVVLLEDLSNLTANECFGGKGFDGAEERILSALAKLQHTAQDVIIVTNELFSDGICYPEQTEKYLKLLARLNQALAQGADCVIECVAGLPVVWKGENPCICGNHSH